jgi:uncharacterized protein (TIGR03067 family)
LKKEAPALAGSWAVVTTVAGGVESPLSNGGSAFLLTAEGTISYRRGQEKARELGTFAVDAKTDPVAIDILSPPGVSDPPVRGIVKVEGDILTLCYLRGGREGVRPPSFEAPVGSDYVLITMKRAKKE